MKRQDVAKLKLGSIIKGKKGDAECFFLILGNNGEKAFCLEPCKEENEKISSIPAEILGQSIFFNTKRITAIAGKNIMTWEGFLPEEQKKALQSLSLRERKENETLKIGDIILYLNQNFIIADCQEELYVCYVYDSNSEELGVQYKIDKKEKIEKVGFCQNFLESLFLKNVKKENLSVGAVVSRKGYLYYIYDKEEDYYKAVRIDFKKGKELIVDHVVYFSTLSEKIQIPKNSKKYNILTIATKKEIQENKEGFLNKKIKKIIEKQPLESKSPVFAGGTIIKSESGEIYIFLFKSEESVICIDYDKYLKGVIYVKDCKNEPYSIIGHIKQDVYREILENLASCYSSYFSKGEIRFILANGFKNC